MYFVCYRSSVSQGLCVVYSENRVSILCVWFTINTKSFKELADLVCCSVNIEGTVRVVHSKHRVPCMFLTVNTEVAYLVCWRSSVSTEAGFCAGPPRPRWWTWNSCTLLFLRWNLGYTQRRWVVHIMLKQMALNLKTVTVLTPILTKETRIKK